MKILSGWTSHEDTSLSDRYPDQHRPSLDNAWFLRHGIGNGPFNATHALIDKHALGSEVDSIAILADEEIWTYRDLASRVQRCATTLVKQLNLRPGHAVVLQCANSPWHAAFILAVWRVGCVAVMCSPLLSDKEVSDIVAFTRAKAWISDSRLDEMIRSANAWSPTDVIGDAVATAPTDPALVLFTSGSTGLPKATLHFHRDLVVVPLTYGTSVTQLKPGDIVAGSPSLGFAYGMESLLLMPLHAGAATVLRGDMTAAGILLTLRACPVSHLFTTPNIIAALIDVGAATDYPSLRMCISAGENLTADLMRRWRALTGVPIANGLGLSELNAFVLGCVPGCTQDGSTGAVVEGFEAKLIDESQRDVPVGEMGRLAIRGPTGCRYIDSPVEQAARVVDGWTLTGDLCVRDAAGVYWHRGRSDDLIVRAGINISPSEIEQTLGLSPLVRECAVTGRFHDDFQTLLIYAHVVLIDDMPAEIACRELRHWAARRLSPHKIPDEFVPIKALPRNRNGKLQRFALHP